MIFFSVLATSSSEKYRKVKNVLDPTSSVVKDILIRCKVRGFWFLDFRCLVWGFLFFFYLELYKFDGSLN